MTQPMQPIYTVQEAAARTGLTAYTLRYYEREGLLAPIPRVPGSGHRRYGEEDLRLLHFLKRMRETGMPIHKIKQYVALILAGEGTVDARRDLLIAHRTAVSENIARLQGHLAAIDEKIANYQPLNREYAEDAARIRERENTP
jgi:DNA-binding transcriptional MerR regulator